MDTAIIEDPTFRIITTLKSVSFNEEDLQPLPSTLRWKKETESFLILHRQRLHAAAQACLWPQACLRLESQSAVADLECATEQAAKQIPKPKTGHIRDVRVRILVNRHGGIQSEGVPMGGERPLEKLEDGLVSCIPQSLLLPSPTPGVSRCLVHVDYVPTSPAFYTSHKTTYRRPYDDARARVGITKCLPTDREVLLFNHQNEVMEASLCTPYFYREGTWTTPPSAAGGMLSVTKQWALDAGLCKEATIILGSIRPGEIIWLSNALRGFFQGRVCEAEERGGMTNSPF
ncbi:uncharacterized protein Z518_09719 [Rhinocladiella mackenziei CBS 650.93]|uniref:Rhinocladiella mackenziei CBS 650.93 unplaced genomic scaffold supercont1.8, whole genome shotgun sequence n=1 Tax=Rhinocladiella mackenziei CBS 650.93 TaxID=1442369 RepID=A0A0D2I4E6_9EURO|nr:uncharacterized protein Z518_09719 [Rhinocladiella mackenziei CBS 650.93]KIX00654.1 hypothetical protein Z518_09719 [Rhinocladiella mackenziei CBS 650.93]